MSSSNIHDISIDLIYHPYIQAFNKALFIAILYHPFTLPLYIALLCCSFVYI